MKKKDIDTRLAEESLLGSILYKPDKIIEVIDEINPNIFSIKEFGNIYNCIVELYKSDIIPDVVTVDKMAQSLGYDIAPELIKKLCNGKTFVAKRQMKEYCEIIKRDAIRRRTIDVCTDYLEKAKDITDPEKILNDFSSITLSLSESIKSKNNLSQIHIDTNSVVEGLLHKMQNPDEMQGLPFGYESIDKATDGACEGEVITIAGMNGGCKTYFSLSVMKNMAKYLKRNNINKYILFFSLEMTKDQLNNRLIAMEAGINAKYLKKPRLYFVENNIQPTEENVKAFIQKIADATKTINSLPILIDDSSVLSARHISLTVKKEHIKRGIACVFIDHAGKVTGEVDNAEDWQIVAKAYLEWTRTAKETKIPFVILLQYLKQLKDQKTFRGTMQDLSGSKAPMNESHKIFHTYKPDIFPTVIEKHPEWIHKVAILNDKNRDLDLMQDVWLAFDNGELKECGEIQKQIQDTVDNIFAGVKGNV